MLRNIQNSHDMRMLQTLALMTSQQLSSLEHVLDLAAVHVHERELLDLMVLDRVRLRRLVSLAGLVRGRFDVGRAGLCTTFDGRRGVPEWALASRGLSRVVLSEEVLPDRGSALYGELGVVEADVDSGLEGWVEGLHSVRGEEHDALVVLDKAQEDADEFVALDFVEGTFLEEDIGFVQ